MKDLHNKIQQIKQEQLVVFLACFVLTGMVFSPFLLSAAMIGYGVLAFFSLKDWRPIFNPDFKKNIVYFISHKGYLVISISFFLVLLSGGFTEMENTAYWWERIRLKIPFLLFPFAFASFRPLSSKHFWTIMYFLTGLLVVTCAGIGIHYLLHFDEINHLLQKGQPMPTPRNHIRFSLLLAYGIFTSFFLYKRGGLFNYKWEKKILLGAVIFLFLSLHLLSVRSGLAAFYAASFILIIQQTLRSKKYFLGISMIALMAAIPFLAYKTVPSFKAKIDYTLYERWRRQHQKSQIEYSDGGRFISLKVGMKIGNEHPVFGVGAGNLRAEVKKQYAAKTLKNSDWKMPHNQFVSTYAGLGGVGLLLFIFAFFFPLFYKKGYLHPLFLSFHIIILLSFMVENTIENSIGIAFYLFFTLLNLNHQSNPTQSNPSKP